MRYLDSVNHYSWVKTRVKLHSFHKQGPPRQPLSSVNWSLRLSILLQWRVPNRAIMSFIQTGVLSDNAWDLYVLEEDLQTLFHCHLKLFWRTVTWTTVIISMLMSLLRCRNLKLAYAKKGGARIWCEFPKW